NQASTEPHDILRILRQVLPWQCHAYERAAEDDQQSNERHSYRIQDSSLHPWICLLNNLSFGSSIVTLRRSCVSFAAAVWPLIEQGCSGTRSTTNSELLRTAPELFRYPRSIIIAGVAAVIPHTHLNDAKAKAIKLCRRALRVRLIVKKRVGEFDTAHGLR